MQKICSKCLVEKDINEFRKEKSRKDGHKNICKVCCRKDGLIHYNNNKERYNRNNKKWCDEHREERNLKRGIIQKEKYHNDIQFRIKHNLRCRLGNVLRIQIAKKSNSTFSLLGCDIEHFMKYIESKFKPEMSWDNYGRGGWTIDHIIPCNLFDLTIKENQEKCFHYTNLQPLWEYENASKGDRFIG